MSDNIHLSSINVETVFLDCTQLYESIETIQLDGFLKETQEKTYHINLTKLKEKEELIKTWLLQLPNVFHKGIGDGWSFLYFNRTNNGLLWTNLYRVAEHLLLMAIALDMAKYLLPKNVWHMLPEEKPYVVIDINKQLNEPPIEVTLT